MQKANLKWHDLFCVKAPVSREAFWIPNLVREDLVWPLGSEDDPRWPGVLTGDPLTRSLALILWLFRVSDKTEVDRVDLASVIETLIPPSLTAGAK
jgi:hypothetical protein